MHIQKSKILVAASFILLGIILLQATNSPTETFFVDESAMGTMLYPKALIYIWLIASVFYVFKGVEQVNTYSLAKALPLLVKIVLCIALYAYLFKVLGLILSTFIFFFLFLLIMKYASFLKVFCVSIGSTFLTWFIFSFVLGVIMPSTFITEFFSNLF